MTHIAMNVFSSAALSHFNWVSIAAVFTTLGHGFMHALDCGGITVGK